MLSPTGCAHDLHPGHNNRFGYLASIYYRQDHRSVDSECVSSHNFLQSQLSEGLPAQSSSSSSTTPFTPSNHPFDHGPHGRSRGLARFERFYAAGQPRGSSDHGQSRWSGSHRPVRCAVVVDRKSSTLLINAETILNIRPVHACIKIRQLHSRAFARYQSRGLRVA